MSFLSKISSLISKLCILIGGICLVSTVGVTLLDIVTRYLYKLTSGGSGFTVQGSLELIEQFMFIALMAAFVAFVERSQIIVDIFTQKLPHSIKALLMGFFVFVFAILGAVFAYGQYELMLDAQKYSMTTQVLRISLVPIHALGLVLSLFLMVRAAIESFIIFATGEYHNAEEAS